MPLIIITGYPKSGKSSIANKISDYFKNNGKEVLICSDSNDKILKNDVYSCDNKEKLLRSNLKSQVERSLRKDTILILDAPNNIKGFRYELYCVSKSYQTTQCLVHLEVHKDVCWKRNETASDPYNKEVFDELIQRFESPNPTNRWDSPMISVFEDGSISFEEISNALFCKKAPPPNFSTQSQPLSSTNFLYEIDKITKDIVNHILKQQKVLAPGAQIIIPGAQEKVVLSKICSPADLMRTRRSYLSFTKFHPASEINKIPDLFVQFINTSLVS